jgi:hypothetical protein
MPTSPRGFSAKRVPRRFSVTETERAVAFRLRASKMWPLGPGLLFEAARMPKPNYRYAFTSPNAKALRNTIRSHTHLKLHPWLKCFANVDVGDVQLAVEMLSAQVQARQTRGARPQRHSESKFFVWVRDTHQNTQAPLLMPNLREDASEKHVLR